jgi:hypothetical protein
MIDLMWPDCSPRFIKALCKLMIKGQSMHYYGAAAKKGADAEGRWLQAKRAAVASSQEVLKKSGAGGGAGTSVGAEAWHMYVDTKSPEFRGLMTALVSLGLEFFVWSAPEADGLLFFKWTRPGPSGLPGPLVAVELLFSSTFSAAAGATEPMRGWKVAQKIAIMLALSNVAKRGIDSRGHALVMGPSHCDYWL